jgi:hypothetical protein
MHTAPATQLPAHNMWGPPCLHRASCADSCRLQPCAGPQYWLDGACRQPRTPCNRPAQQDCNWAPGRCYETAHPRPPPADSMGGQVRQGPAHTRHSAHSRKATAASNRCCCKALSTGIGSSGSSSGRVHAGRSCCRGSHGVVPVKSGELGTLRAWWSQPQQANCHKFSS